MSQRLRIHPGNPQLRLVRNAADTLANGGLIVYPTDSCYALGCQLGDKAALERMRRLRRSERDHEFTLVCRDLSEIAVYARVDNAAYRILRSLTPGPYTFILRATNEVPNRLQDPRRRSIGIRVPDHAIVAALLEAAGGPVMSSTLILPDDELPLADPDEIYERLRGQVDVVIDAGACGIEPTTVLDLSEGAMEVVRHGKGDIRGFESKTRTP